LSSFKIHIIQFYAFNQVLTSIHRPFTSVNTQKKRTLIRMIEREVAFFSSSYFYYPTKE